MAKTSLCSLAFVFLLLIPPVVLPCSLGYAATYTGRVVDDAGEPIAGAVVVAQWSEVKGTLTGGTSRIEDIKETVTDSNGAWSIDGPSGVKHDSPLIGIFTVMTLLTGTHYTLPPHFTIFKPGYCPYPDGFGVQACKEKLKPRPRSLPDLGNGETAQLPRLLDPADRERALPHPVAGGAGQGKELLSKQKKFTELINEERRNLGLRELDFEEPYKYK